MCNIIEYIAWVVVDKVDSYVDIGKIAIINHPVIKYIFV